MATCPSCGSEQTGAAAFCTTCGAVLDRPNTSNEPSAQPPPREPPTAASSTIPPRVSVAAPSTATMEFGDIGGYVVRRLLALLVDIVLVTVLIAIALHHVLASRGADPSSSSAFFETFIYTLFAVFVYRCVGEAYVGTTLGKALFSLRVQALEGGSVGIIRAIVRNIFLPFDLLVVGFLLAAITPRRRRIGDLVAGTEVVNLRIGALAPVVAAAVLGGWAFLDYEYADGLRTAQVLRGDAERYGPALVQGQATPIPIPSPASRRGPAPAAAPTPGPTAAPTAGPTAAPTPAPSTAPSAAPASPQTPTTT